VKHETGMREALFATSFMLVSCLAYSLNLMEATCFSEMLVVFQWTTWHYISEDKSSSSTFHAALAKTTKTFF
jgi:hypothetical protein